MRTTILFGALFVSVAAGWLVQNTSAQERAISATATSPDPREIIRRSVEKDAQNYELLSKYTYTEVSVERRYEKDGSIKSSESETHEVMILAGSPYEKLIARDGNPLSEKDARKEQEKLDKELAKRLKNPEKERAEFEKDRAEQRDFAREIPDAFAFTLLGTEILGERPTWKIAAEPLPDFKPRNGRADVLKKVRGTVWVDQADYQWVKADLKVIDTISWGWFVLLIDPGGTIQFEQSKINDEIWLPSRVDVRAEARLALLKRFRLGFETRYSDYRRFESSSQIVGVEELDAPE